MPCEALRTLVTIVLLFPLLTRIVPGVCATHAFDIRRKVAVQLFWMFHGLVKPGLISYFKMVNCSGREYVRHCRLAASHSAAWMHPSF